MVLPEVYPYLPGGACREKTNLRISYCEDYGLTVYYKYGVFQRNLKIGSFIHQTNTSQVLIMLPLVQLFQILLTLAIVESAPTLGDIRSDITLLIHDDIQGQFGIVLC